MSADTISGISVIQRSYFWPKCQIYRVGHMLHHADGRRTTISLCMTDTSEPPDAVAICGEPVWQFIKGTPRHGWIACKPSVRQFVTIEGKEVDLFHNTYDWQVQYVEMRWQEPGIGQQPMQIERYDVLIRLNNPELTDAERAMAFDELRRHGVIY